MITRPVRERPAEQVRTMIREGLERTGYDEVALTSLSTADFSGIEEVIGGIVTDAGCDQVSVALPSLRVDAFTVGIAAQLQRARRTGLTFAPEAGSWRLRQVINKLISEEDLYGAVESAYSQGWRRMKLYFLTGLPTETDEDTLGIAELARNCVELGRTHHKSPSVTVSVGGFVPKPFTPFQWFGQNTVVELQRKIGLLRDDLRRSKNVKLKWHEPRATLVEGITSRGDRRLGPVIEYVWRRGGTFQEWSEHFSYDLWLEAMVANELRCRLVRPPPPHRRRGASLGSPLGRSAQGLPVAGLARCARRARARGLPLDTVLRLRCLHRLRDRTCGGLGHATGGWKPGTGVGPSSGRSVPVVLQKRPTAGVAVS